MIAAMVLAHGGHNDGGGIWLVIPLVVVGVLLWLSNRRKAKDTPTERKLPSRNEEIGESPK